MSRSLGTLTVDIVAQVGGFVRGMDSSERAARNWRRQVERHVNQAGRVARQSILFVAGASTAAAAAITAMTVAGMRNVNQQSVMARSLNTTYDSITALQQAFSDGGIDNFDASLNRLNRRLGAAELGRGAALNAVKELNLDLRELAGVEADERLAIIADRINEVATNSQTAARYAQDLGFEQREAAQFFMQGGDAIRSYRENVDLLGLSLSDISARQVENANSSLSIMGDITRGLTQQLAVQFAPVIEGIATLVRDWVIEMGGVPQVAERVFSALVYGIGVAADGMDGLYRLIQISNIGLSVFGHAGKIIMQELALAILDGPVQMVNLLIEQMNRIPNVNIDYVSSMGLADTIRSDLNASYDYLREAPGRIRDIVDREHPSEIFAAWVEDAIASSRAAASQSAQAAVSVVDDFSFSDDVISRFESLNSALASPLENAIRQYSEYYAEIQALHEEGILSAERASELRLRAETNYLEELERIRVDEGGYWDRWLAGAGDALTSFDEMAGNVLESFSGQFGSAFESMIFDSESLGDAVGNMAVNMSRSVINALGQMAAQWLAYQAVQLMTGKTAQISAATTLGANAQASALQAGISAFASTAAIPIVGPAMAPAAMAAALSVTQPMAVAVGAAALSGMAHDGIDSIPQTGTWLLEKGERVTTAQTSAKLDATLDRIQVSQGAGVNITQEFTIEGDASERTVSLLRQAARQGAEDGYRMVMNDLRTNGPVRQAMRS